MSFLRQLKKISVIVVLSSLGLGFLAGCSNNDPLATNADDGTIVVGSQDYFSNEIIAEIYAQALEAAGIPVTRDFRIGQREVYIPEVENGNIDLFPEYTGPLLKYWDPNATARSPEDVYQALTQTTPTGLRVLEQSPATDQDTYVVTRKFAEEWDLHSVADLAKVTTSLTMGGNSEGENRPHGPQGLKDSYGVAVRFTPIEDSGGPLTVRALKDNSIQLGIMYTASPLLLDDDLVQLDDPHGLLLSSHIVPLASASITKEAEQVINGINAKITTEVLIELNRRGVNEKLSATTIATDWLADNSSH